MEDYKKLLDELLVEYDLENIREYLYENIKNNIYLGIGEKDNYNLKGVSRVGGYPDVQKDFEWPKTKSEEPMTFIAQLNLNDISSNDKRNLLPQNGILYFFMGRYEPAYDIEHKVIFVESYKNLVTMKLDEPAVLEKYYENFFTAYKLESKASFEIPNYAYMSYDIIEDDEYIEIEETVHFENEFENSIGKIYGYPDGQHGDAELEAALKIIANCKYSYSSKDKGKLAKALNNSEESANNEIKNMEMLLEIKSSDEVGFTWWDCGVIHFFIRQEDLINKDFSKTYLSLYSS